MLILIAINYEFTHGLMVIVIMMTTIAVSTSTCLILLYNTSISSIDANDVIHANDADSSPGSSKT